MMSRKILCWFLLVNLTCGLAAGRAVAQTATIDSGLPTAPGTRDSTMGPSPGSGGGVFGNSPGGGGSILGGRPGVATPHQIPTSISTPGNGGGVTDLQAQINTPAPAPLQSSSRSAGVSRGEAGSGCSPRSTAMPTWRCRFYRASNGSSTS